MLRVLFIRECAEVFFPYFSQHPLLLRNDVSILVSDRSRFSHIIIAGSPLSRASRQAASTAFVASILFVCKFRVRISCVLLFHGCWFLSTEFDRQFLRPPPCILSPLVSHPISLMIQALPIGYYRDVSHFLCPCLSLYLVSYFYLSSRTFLMSSSFSFHVRIISVINSRLVSTSCRGMTLQSITLPIIVYSYHHAVYLQSFNFGGWPGVCPYMMLSWRKHFNADMSEYASP